MDKGIALRIIFPLRQKESRKYDVYKIFMTGTIFF